MRIEELILDGFKSYASHTVISGWDAQFTCITGLNGSGKSNILDAICFVLGISNMSTVRAQNLQDLIYKRGNAGVTKASVTIVFDNKDAKKSPIGFETSVQISVTRQIVLGGTSKYLINGHRAQQHAVQNLFQSVGLNINNPNFLIMQGRITKVLNMKPAEILSMIEEAAGTRMFEDRKDKAFKTMSKKDKKVEEINSLLAEEIEPKLEKLRAEKRAFLELQQTQSDMERLTKVVVAYDYVKGAEKLADNKKGTSENEKRLKALQDAMSTRESEITNIEQQIAHFKNLRELELKKGGKGQNLEIESRNMLNELTRLTASIDLQKSAKADEITKQRDSEKAVTQNEKELQKHTADAAKFSEIHEAIKRTYDVLRAEAVKQEELLQTLTTGISSKAGQDNGYMDQLQDAKSRMSETNTKQEQAKVRIAHLELRVKEEEPAVQQAMLQNKSLLKELEQMRGRAEELQNKLRTLGWSEGEQDEGAEHEATIMARIKSLSAKADAMRKKVANLDFTYSDPSPNFDRSKVKGLVAQLFSLDKENFDASTAIEVSAGGRLYNVVVDTESTGSQLLKNGGLRRRVTIIPLNKITAFKASAAKIGAAKKLARGKVDLALSLIGYEKEVSAAMEYVFGTTLICVDSDTARLVTFDDAVKMKSVTYQGDVYDPAGTLSGGSSASSNGALVALQQLNTVTRDLAKENLGLQELHDVQAREQKKTDHALSIKHELDLKSHEIEVAEQQIDGNTNSALIKEVEDMKATVQRLKQEIKNHQAQQTATKAEIATIETDMKEFKTNKGSKLTSLRQQVEKLKEKEVECNASLKQATKDMQTSKIELDQSAGELEEGKQALHELTQSISSASAEISKLEADHDDMKEKYDAVLAELEDERNKMTGFEEELRDLQDTGAKKRRQMEESNREVSRLQHELDRAGKEQQGAHQYLRQLENDHEWIEEAKVRFGQVNSPYDFGKHDIAQCKASLQTVSERFYNLRKKVNDKVMNMIDSVEKKERSLQEMMHTVMRDKKKIEDTIESLDEYKREALHTTWEKVNA